MEEIPVLDSKEQAELLRSLRDAEADIRAGKGIEYNPKKFRDRLLRIYRDKKR
jgi:hypothetical protein